MKRFIIPLSGMHQQIVGFPTTAASSSPSPSISFSSSSKGTTSSTATFAVLQQWPLLFGNATNTLRQKRFTRTSSSTYQSGSRPDAGGADPRFRDRASSTNDTQARGHSAHEEKYSGTSAGQRSDEEDDQAKSEAKCTKEEQERRDKERASPDGDHNGCPFKYLNLDPNTATLEICRTRYRELVKTHHPDVGGCTERFKKIRKCYEECKVRIEAGFRPDEHHEDYTWDAYKQYETERDEAAESRLREAYRVKLSLCSDSAELDKLLTEAIASFCFHSRDVGEPLSIALSRYHIDLGLGPVHVDRCFNAMNRWEDSVEQRCGNIFYHVLLTLYTNEAFVHTCDAMTLTEVVTLILERMTEKGLTHDDWTLVLANRAFRASPFPDW